MNKQEAAEMLRWLRIEDSLVGDDYLIDEAVGIAIATLESPPYTHRNGETEIPDELGAYWVYDDRGINGITPNPRIEILGNTAGRGMAWHRERHPHLRYYGPIPQPEGVA